MVKPYIGQRVSADVSGAVGYDGLVDEGTSVTGTIVDIAEISGEITVSLDVGVDGLNRITVPVNRVLATL